MMKSRAFACVSLLLVSACALPTESTPTAAAEAEVGAATGAVASEEIPLNHVFVTTGVYHGDLKSQGGGANGPAGANNLCNQEAAAAGLSGTYQAMLYQTRPSINGIGTWRNVLNQVVFSNLSSVKNGPAQLTLLVTANGASVPANSTIWSGILPNNNAGAACTRNGLPWEHDGAGLDGSLKTGHVTNLSALPTWPRGDVPRHCALKRRLICVRSY